MKIKNVFIIFIIISYMQIGITCSFAGVGVKPTIIETTVRPGEAKKGTYTVVNSDPAELHVDVELENWLEKRTGRQTIPVEDWLTITPMEFDIEPMGVKEVEYEINVPDGIEGELVAMVFFASAVPVEGAFDITSRFGVSIYAAIENTFTLDCNIVNMQVKRNIIQGEGGDTIDRGLVFIVDIENKGNVHLRPTGVVQVTAEDGAVYYVQMERGFPVYAGTTLDYAIMWDKTDLAPGKYKATAKMNYGAIYGLDDKRIEKNINFFVNTDGSISY